VWPKASHQPFPLAYGDHAGVKPSTSDHKIHEKKGKFKFPCRLCEGNHTIDFSPYMGEASKVLENFTTSQRHLSASYQQISPNPSLVDKVIDQNPNPINPNISKCESHEFVPNQPLVEEMLA